MNHLHFEQKTKIVATVGPASSSYENLRALAQAGVNVFRLNFSHGSHDVHQEVINRIIRLNEEQEYHVGILADLQGPKIRIGQIENETINIAPGDQITFTNEECLGNKDRVYMSYTEFPKDVNPGDRILLDDGKVVMKVLETDRDQEVKLEVVHGTTLSSRKGVNLPDTNISMPSLTEKDLNDLEYILTQPVHWIALSFVRLPRDVRELRERINAVGHQAKIISKIEKPSAVEKIDNIIRHSDAVMIARGDLGIEVAMEKLPSIQKLIIKKCIQAAKPVIVATQMMDSMITNPSPTRAEITDVANAVLDGTDAVMLSGETSVGQHPVRVVEAMNKIILEAEQHYELSNKRPVPSKKSGTYYSDVICLTVGSMANEIEADGIITITSTGYTAFKISSYRPDCRLFVFSNKEYMLKTLSLCWGVHCFYYDGFTSTDETVDDVVNLLKNNKAIKVGDVVINTGSMPLHRRLRTNMCKITIVE